MPLDLKSRLVGRGDFENLEGVRTDSPTMDIEGHSLIFSFAASNKIEIKSADISNAYFQGKELDRILLLRPPKGGLPDPDYADGETMILARVPIYGTPDAGRFFWKQFKETIEDATFKENTTLRALYGCVDRTGNIQALLGTHVDDMMWAAVKDVEHQVQKILDHFDCRKIEKGEFRFCGKEVKQFADFSIKVTCKDTSEKVELIMFTKNGRKMTERGSEHEIGQMRSVIGS